MKIKIFLITFVLIISLLLITGSFFFYKAVFYPNERVKYPVTVYIPTGADINTVIDTLSKKKLISNKKLFLFIADKKNYTKHIKSGKYIFSKPVNLNNLINILRSGQQSPVIVRFNPGIHNIKILSGKLAQNIEASADEIEKLLTDRHFIDSLGFNKHTILAMFIPNTYEVYWNTSARGIILRMKKEYEKFWNKDRIAKAAKIPLSWTEVSTLASIVCKETTKNDEKPVIAGVYINRLQKGVPLQADPTVIFANKAWGARRVTTKMLEADSPYNTYKYKGLPPGPICIPDIASIDAVLNYRKHNYLYFCAKEDFSGYHNFAKTYSQHLKNARKYQQQLNKLKIYR